MVVRANPEKKEEKERIRHALFHATLSLASAHGFASLGLREVSREALIAPTSFYRHFEDMEQLGLALIDEKVGPLLREVSETARARSRADGSPFAAVPHAVPALFEAAADDGALVRFFLAERVGGIARFRGAIEGEIARFTTGLIAGSDAPGTLQSAARAIVAVLLDATFFGLEREGEARAETAATALVQLEMIVRGAGSTLA